MEQRKGDPRTVRTRRPLLAGISFVCTTLVFLLFSFPNYCDNCAYRNITLYAYSMAPERPPSGSPCSVPPEEQPERLHACCAGAVGTEQKPEPAPPTESHEGSSIRHVRVPYCLSYSVSSIAGCRDIPEAARGLLPAAPLRVIDRAFSRLTVILDHKESRAPPA